MACAEPRTLMRTFDGTLVSRNDFLDAFQNLADVFAFGRNINIHFAAQLIMIHFGRRRRCADGADGVEPRRQSADFAPRNGMDDEVGQVFDGIFGILHGQQIIVAAFRIHPVARRDHLVGSQRGDDVADDFLFIQTKFAGAQAVHVQLQRGIINVLRHQHVADARQRSRTFRAISSRDLMRAFQVLAADLNVHRRGHPQIQNRRPPIRRFGNKRRFAAIPFSLAHAPGPCIQSCSTDDRDSAPPEQRPCAVRNWACKWTKNRA